MKTVANKTQKDMDKAANLLLGLVLLTAVLISILLISFH